MEVIRLTGAPIADLNDAVAVFPLTTERITKFIQRNSRKFTICHIIQKILPDLAHFCKILVNQK